MMWHLGEQAFIFCFKILYVTGCFLHMISRIVSSKKNEIATESTLRIDWSGENWSVQNIDFSPIYLNFYFEKVSKNLNETVNNL